MGSVKGKASVKASKVSKDDGNVSVNQELLQELLIAIGDTPGVKDAIGIFMRGRGYSDPQMELIALYEAAFGEDAV